MQLSRLIFIAILLIVGACASAPNDADSGFSGNPGFTGDAGDTADSGEAADAGEVSDAGSSTDSGISQRFDAGPRDAGEPDAGRPDAGTPDAGRPDAGSSSGCQGNSASIVDYFTHAAISNVTVTLDGAHVSASAGELCTASLPSGVHPLSIASTGYATWNGAIQVPDGAQSRTIPLFPESSAMSAWLTKVNSDRAANGATAVQLDSMLCVAAFDHAADMASQGYFAHFDPHGFAPTTRSLLLGSMMMGSENIAEGYATWTDAESGFMSEKSALPHMAASDCPADDSAAGHYCNIVWPTHNWVGLGIAAKNSQTVYYDQEFGGLYGYYDTTVVPSEPRVGGSASVQFVGANGASINGVNMETMAAPVAIPIATLNSDPTCSSSCPATDQWYGGSTTFPNQNPLQFSFSTEQIYIGALDTTVQPFVGYGAYVYAFAGGTVAPTGYTNSALNVQSQ